MEQQYQNGVDEQHAGKHRQRKARHHLAENFRIARRQFTHAWRQVAHGGQLLDFIHHGTDGSTAQLALDDDIAATVETLHLGSATPFGNRRHDAQWYGPSRGRHPQLSQGLQITAFR